MQNLRSMLSWRNIHGSIRILLHRRLRLRTHLEISLGVSFAILVALLVGCVCHFYFDAPFAFAVFAGILVLLVVLWTTEALPIGVTSLLPIILFPAFGILDVSQATSNYGNPIIFLFLGGFMLAVATEKIGLHRIIAKKLLAFFPKTPRGIITALGAASVALGTKLSNSTVPLLLITVARSVTQDSTLRSRFLLAVAFGASISGITTPIGTPPNLIYLGFLRTVGFEAIGFTTWIFMMLPLTLTMLAIMVWILSWRCKDMQLESNSLGNVKMTKEHIRLLVLLGGLLIILLLNSPIKPYYDGLGFNENVILLAFGLLMFAPKIGFLEWEDSKLIPYEIIFLFGAGFCIAMAISKIQLGDAFQQIFVYFADLPFILFLLFAALVTLFATMFISSTALIAIFLPVVFAATQSFLDAPTQSLTMLIVTISAGFAFMFPISTPPNAIVFSKGGISIRQMFGFGIVLSLIGVALVIAFGMLYWRFFF